MEKTMTYEEFKNKVVEDFKKYLPERFQKMELRVQKCLQNNSVILDGINLYDKDYSGPFVSPLIYVNIMYDYYIYLLEKTRPCADCNEESQALTETLCYYANFYVEAMVNIPDFSASQFSQDKAKKRIVYELVNTQKNETLLKDVPSRKFLDFSIIYRWIVDISEDKSIKSIVITKALAEKLNLCEDELFTLASKNTRKLLPPKIESLKDFLSIDWDDYPAPEDEGMWIISNTSKIKGAIVMLDEITMETLAQKFKSNFYILPSSVHEVLALPEKACPCVEQLASMVYEVNETQVSPDDILSYNVYQYDRDTKKITKITTKAVEQTA